jgi:hypothetical protein
MTLKLSLVAFASLAVLLTAGCGPKPEEPAAATPASGATADKSVGDTKPASGGQVLNAPPTGSTTSGGYRIAPANPNDPHFKPDPRLAGGG